MDAFSRSPALRRHDRRILIASFVYMASFFVAVHHRSGSVLAYGIALVPGLAIVAMFVAIGRYLVEEGDEYLRARAVHRVVLASGAAMVFVSLWGFLEIAGLPHLHLYAVSVVWFVGFGVAAGLQRREDK